MSQRDNQSEPVLLPQSCQECRSSRLVNRRTLLKSLLGTGVGLQLIRRTAHAVDDPKKMRPQVGDLLVFSLGNRQGQVITSQDIPVGGPPIIAYAMEPSTQTVRDGSRLNRVLLVRLTTADFTEATRPATADGIVGYSAVCTHTGCDVVGWKSDTKELLCPCHASAFDPKDRARVLGGPAPRALPLLPLQLADGKLAVAGPFSGRVGADQK
jgi:rieske iron-sulfur protein